MEELSVEMSLSETVATAANIGCKAIQLWGTPSFKAERLRKFVEGSETLTLAMADSGAGSDASASTTIAVSGVVTDTFSFCTAIGCICRSCGLLQAFF